MDRAMEKVRFIAVHKTTIEKFLIMLCSCHTRSVCHHRIYKFTDPVCEKLQEFLESGYLSTQHIFYKLKECCGICCFNKFFFLHGKTVPMGSRNFGVLGHHRILRPRGHSTSSPWTRFL